MYVYIYLYVFTYVYIYIIIHVYLCVYVPVSLSLSVSLTHTLSLLHTHTRTNTHTHTHTHRRMFVVNSRHLVLARIKTPKKSYKISENAVSDTLLMSGFQIFAADAAFQNRALRDDLFTHLTTKNALSFQDFCQQACWWLQNFCSKNQLRFVTPDKNSSMNTLWEEKEFDSADMQQRIANEKMQ